MKPRIIQFSCTEDTLARKLEFHADRGYKLVAYQVMLVPGYTSWAGHGPASLAHFVIMELKDTQ